MTTDLEVREVEPGQYEVTTAAGGQHRVVVPAGVGIPGFADEDLAGAVVAELGERSGGARLAGVLDVSALFGADPGLLAAVEARLEHEEET